MSSIITYLYVKDLKRNSLDYSEEKLGICIESMQNNEPLYFLRVGFHMIYSKQAQSSKEIVSDYGFDIRTDLNNLESKKCVNHIEKMKFYVHGTKLKYFYKKLSDESKKNFISIFNSDYAVPYLSFCIGQIVSQDEINKFVKKHLVKKNLYVLSSYAIMGSCVRTFKASKMDLYVPKGVNTSKSERFQNFGDLGFIYKNKVFYKLRSFSDFVEGLLVYPILVRNFDSNKLKGILHQVGFDTAKLKDANLRREFIVNIHRKTDLSPREVSIHVTNMLS